MSFVQLATLLPSLLLTAIHSQPRVTEPVVMTVLLLLLLQLPPSLMALSQDTRLSLPTLVMANRLLPLPLRGMDISSDNNKTWEFQKNMLIGLLTFCLCFVSISYNANSQPATYSQNSYSQPAAYGQQPGYQGQQAGYNQQQGYQQQTQPQQQAPPAYPPQAGGSYGQPPANQYNQQGGPPSYSQSSHYSKLCFPPA